MNRTLSSSIQLAHIACIVAKRGAVLIRIILMDSQCSKDGKRKAIGLFICNLFSGFGSGSPAQQREYKKYAIR